MPNKYQHLLSVLEPYLVTYDVNPYIFNKTVLEKTIKQESYYHPLKLSSQVFIEKIYAMDRLTFGGQGMGMDKWVFLDCSVMPGFAFGLKIKGKNLFTEDRKLLGISENEDYPVSLYIAIPTQTKDVWFGHNLSSLNGILKTPLKGLGFLTKYMALNLFEIKTQRGATQWNSPALRLHLKFSPLKLLSAYTPIHSKPATLCYEASLDLSMSEIICNYEELGKSGEFQLIQSEYIKIQNALEQGERIFLTAINDDLASYWKA